MIAALSVAVIVLSLAVVILSVSVTMLSRRVDGLDMRSLVALRRSGQARDALVDSLPHSARVAALKRMEQSGE